MVEMRTEWHGMEWNKREEMRKNVIKREIKATEN